MSLEKVSQVMALSVCLVLFGFHGANAGLTNPHPTGVSAAVGSNPASKLACHDSEGESKRLLDELGFKRNTMAAVTRVFFHPFAFLVIVLLLTLGALVGDLALAKRNMQLNLGSRILAVSVLLAVFQWHASLEQDAMQRYEAEIANANAAETSEAVAAMLPDLYFRKTGHDIEKVRYVYIHLDNLEYAAERYKQGFASAATTERAVMTFVGHCRELEFRELAQRQVQGYSNNVQTVVAAIIKEL